MYKICWSSGSSVPLLLAGGSLVFDLSSLYLYVLEVMK